MVRCDAIEDTDDNRRRLLRIAQEAFSYDGGFDWSDVYGSVNELFTGSEDPERIANAVHYGSYDPMADWHRFDGYANIQSLNDRELLEEAWDERRELTEWAKDNEPGLLEDLTYDE